MMKKIKVRYIDDIQVGELIEYNGDPYLVLEVLDLDIYNRFNLLNITENKIEKNNLIVFKHKLFWLQEEE